MGRWQSSTLLPSPWSPVRGVCVERVRLAHGLTAKPADLYKLKTCLFRIPTSRHTRKSMPEEFCHTQDGPLINDVSVFNPRWVCICMM